MWIASQHGFYSIVRQGPDRYVIRARLREDLERLIERTGERGPMQFRAEPDFPYRLLLDLEGLLEILVQLGADLDYPDFEERLAERPDQWEKLSAYQRLQTDLNTLQTATDPEQS
jgi:hypothetical protein